MPPQGSLITCSEQEPTKELTLDAQVEVLRGGVFHICIHCADGHPFPGMRNRIARVISGANRCRVRIENCIAAGRAEVNQCVKGRIPSAVGPYIVEDAVIVDSITATN